MKSFSLNENHDIDIKNNEIQLTEGSELVRQTVECTLNTKAGEWFLNDELGIDFNAILGKGIPDDETVKNVVLEGLRQVDETFRIDDFETAYNSKTRKLTVNFTASTDSGRVITISDIWG